MSADDDLDDFRDLRDVEQGGDARHDVLADRGGGRDDGVIAAGERDDQRRQRLGQIVGKARIVGKQHLGDAGKLGGCIGGSLGALAGDQHMHIAADLGSRRQRLGGLVGKACIVVVSQKKNGHGYNLPVPELKARRLRSSACRRVRRPT